MLYWGFCLFCMQKGKWGRGKYISPSFSSQHFFNSSSIFLQINLKKRFFLVKMKIASNYRLNFFWILLWVKTFYLISPGYPNFPISPWKKSEKLSHTYFSKKFMQPFFPQKKRIIFLFKLIYFLIFSNKSFSILGQNKKNI